MYTIKLLMKVDQFSLVHNCLLDKMDVIKTFNDVLYNIELSKP